MLFTLATTATQPSHYVDQENRRSSSTFGSREAVPQYCLQWKACWAPHRRFYRRTPGTWNATAVANGPLMPRCTASLAKKFATF